MPKSKSAATSNAYKPPKTLQTACMSHSFDVYQSDVFSLGMTLLSMASLQLFVETSQGSNWVEKVDLMVEGLAYSDKFKAILRKMLWRDAATRPDFKEMKKLLQKQRFRATQAAARKASHHMETFRFTHLNSLFAGWKSSTRPEKPLQTARCSGESAENQY